MKTLKLIVLPLIFAAMAATGQERVEVPGDNFSLEGALQLFKKSSSPEEFERMLNSQDSKVNNLDLNGDGMIDYIRVIDQVEGNIHVFILQAVLSERESQDVAVIELQKLENGKAILQIVGDEDVYGVETIIEPTREVSVYAGAMTNRTVVNVWSWPVVQYVYDPYYTVWVSPWTWFFRPVWWFSWRPIVYYDYYSYWRPYRTYYSFCYSHRISYAPQIYHPYRTYSHTYRDRHHRHLADYREKHRNDRGNHNGYDRDHRDRDERGRGQGNHYGNNRNNDHGNDRDPKERGRKDHPTRNFYTDQRTGRDRYDAGISGRDTKIAQRTSTQRPQSDVFRTSNERTTRTSPSQLYRPTEKRQSTVQQNQRPVRQSQMIQRSSPTKQERSIQGGNGNSNHRPTSISRPSQGNSNKPAKTVSSPSRGNSQGNTPGKPSNGGGRGNGKGRGNN